MITVNDIREKKFGKAKHGYNEDEVDDFLDEIAEQLEVLIRENRSMIQQVEDLKAAAAYIPPISSPTPQPVPAPVYEAPVAASPIGDEPTYFRNLEVTLRETLISAQRIADETTAEARKKARQTVTAAEEQANSILTSAKSEVEDAKQTLDALKLAAADYRQRFLRIVQDQMRTLGEDEDLFS